MRGFVIVAGAAMAALIPEIVAAEPLASPEGLTLTPGAAPSSAGQINIAQGGPNSDPTRRGPADLCQELLAFVHASSPEPVAAGQPSPQTATAVQQPAQGTPVPLPAPGGGTPQQTSGMSAPVAPSGQGASGPQGATQQGSGSPPAGQGAQSPAQGAPGATVTVAPSPIKPSATQIERIEAAARDHSLQGCRDAAQDMRRAGVAMPTPLLALATLDLKFFEDGQRQ
jgi:hypothetical protein